jgi:hypothetical protein
VFSSLGTASVPFLKKAGPIAMDLRNIRPRKGPPLIFGLAALLGVAFIAVGGSAAGAAPAPVGLGTASSFAVLAGSTVTNTGPSVISGDLGVSPGSAVTGLPPGIVVDGTVHTADSTAAQAEADTTTAFNDAADRTPTQTGMVELGGLTLVAGVYSGGSLGLTGTLTLNGQNDPSSVFIFQAASSLITASDSGVSFINGASACNVYWEVDSSATLGTGTHFDYGYDGSFRRR